MAYSSQTQSPLRAAVIGTGKISEEHLRFLSADPRVVLAGVCDLSPSLAKYAVARFGAKQAFTDSAQMLAEAKPDAIMHFAANALVGESMTNPSNRLRHWPAPQRPPRSPARCRRWFG